MGYFFDKGKITFLIFNLSLSDLDLFVPFEIDECVSCLFVPEVKLLHGCRPEKKSAYKTTTFCQCSVTMLNNAVANVGLRSFGFTKLAYFFPHIFTFLPCIFGKRATQTTLQLLSSRVLIYSQFPGPSMSWDDAKFCVTLPQLMICGVVKLDLLNGKIIFVMGQS